MYLLIKAIYLFICHQLLFRIYGYYYPFINISPDTPFGLQTDTKFRNTRKIIHKTVVGKIILRKKLII